MIEYRSLLCHTMVRSGYINIYGTGLMLLGIGSYYWSSMSHGRIDYAYYLDFNGITIDPAYSLYRNYAFPLRCLAS